MLNLSVACHLDLFKIYGTIQECIMKFGQCKCGIKCSKQQTRDKLWHEKRASIRASLKQNLKKSVEPRKTSSFLRQKVISTRVRNWNIFYNSDFEHATPFLQEFPRAIYRRKKTFEKKPKKQSWEGPEIVSENGKKNFVFTWRKKVKQKTNVASLGFLSSLKSWDNKEKIVIKASILSKWVENWVMSKICFTHWLINE